MLSAGAGVNKNFERGSLCLKYNDLTYGIITSPGIFTEHLLPRTLLMNILEDSFQILTGFILRTLNTIFFQIGVLWCASRNEWKNDEREPHSIRLVVFYYNKPRWVVLLNQNRTQITPWFTLTTIIFFRYRLENKSESFRELFYDGFFVFKIIVHSYLQPFRFVFIVNFSEFIHSITRFLDRKAYLLSVN